MGSSRTQAHAHVHTHTHARTLKHEHTHRHTHTHTSEFRGSELALPGNRFVSCVRIHICSHEIDSVYREIEPLHVRASASTGTPASTSPLGNALKFPGSRVPPGPDGQSFRVVRAVECWVEVHLKRDTPAFPFSHGDPLVF